ncbi:Tfx family DNA-binding protein [Desulfurococcaceae archaeon MEX13E-LK6-19]|nr:Tfx family DNA-binding protein [Desulfurococcaceae archaeon MEX13E-LK6-19]
MSGKYGFLTEQQVKVLKLRSKGLSLRQIAEIMGTSHQNIAVAEKRALEKIRQAEKTILVYKLITSPIKIVIEENTRLIDIPRIIIDEADKKNIRVKGDFTLIYKILRYKTPDCIQGQKTVKPILVLVEQDGTINAYNYSDIEDLVKEIEEI